MPLADLSQKDNIDKNDGKKSRFGFFLPKNQIGLTNYDKKDKIVENNSFDESADL